MNDLSVNEKILRIMFHAETLNKVKEQFISKREKQPLNAFEMNFRLFLTSYNTINFELLSACDLGVYFKPIGFFYNGLIAYILKEFEPALLILKKNNVISELCNVNTLKIQENALIAAYSAEILSFVSDIFIEVKQRGFDLEFIDDTRINPFAKFDKKLIVNGLKVELLMSFQEFPQFFLDDIYNVEGAFAAYQLNQSGGIDLKGATIYQQAYQNLSKLNLLSAYKFV